MGTFTLKCNKCGKERELHSDSVADKGEITIEKFGSYDEGTIEKFYIDCSCENWVEFDRF